MNDLSKHIGEILDIVEKAGKSLLEIYQKQNLEIEIKPDATPVTEADKISNKILCEGLKGLFPDIPIMSEEANIPEYSVRKKWDYYWLIDPLDGTKEFIYKNGRFCINVALIHRNTPVFGMINNILNREILWAFKDKAPCIKINGTVSELSLSETTGAKLKMVVSRFNMTEQEFEYTDFLQSKGYSIELQPLGASAKQCEIAKGNADIFVKFGKCYEWDIAAGQIIVESAGGMVVNPETYSNLTYNKEDLTNPPLIMFSKKLKNMVEDGNEVFIHYK